MKMFYGLVHKEEDSAFGVSFPDVPGCFSAADEEADLLTNAQEALSLHLDGAEVPAARSVAEIMRDKDVKAEIEAGAFVLAVPIIESRRKSRFNLMLDDELVASVDRVAKVSGVSRSEFVSQAVQTQLSSEVHAVFADRGKKRPSRLAATDRHVASSTAKMLKSKTASKEAKSAAASTLTQKKK